MQQTVPQCASCDGFTRRSLHHEEEYQSSMLLERPRTTNFLASDEQISHVRHTILPTVADDISSIDSKITSLHEVIRSMEEERERLINVQRNYSNLISLHRTLPSEIWSEIFLHTLSSTSRYNNAFDASGPIWKFSHVCQKWRNIALSLRSFWSTLQLRFPEAAQQEADVQRLETIIQRSRQGLLNVSLRHDIPSRLSPGCDLSILDRMLNIIFAESYRWREATLSCLQEGWNILYAPLHNRLPRLESLTLYFMLLEVEEQSVVPIFEDCPHLTKATFGGAIPPVVHVKLPWHQLTELDLSPLDLAESEEQDRRACMRLVGLCPSLEALSLPDWVDDDEPYTPITCSNMRKLDATSVPVIDTLTLPRLREASFHPEPVTTRYDALYSFKQLLIRSNCLGALTSLSLASVPLAASPDCTLHFLLSQTPSLTSLNLVVSMQEYDDQTDSNYLEQIVMIVESLEVIPTKTVTFLPLLSSVDIHVYNHRDPRKLQYFGPVGIFASTVKARWEGNDTVGLARLRTCHFAVQARHLEQVVHRGDRVVHIFTETERLTFRALIDDGMDLAIRVTSHLSANIGGHNTVFAVPS